MHIGIVAPVSIDQIQSLFSNGQDDLPSGYQAPIISSLIQELWNRGHTLSVFTLDPTIRKPVTASGDRIKIYVGVYRTPARYRMIDFYHSERQFLTHAIQQDNCVIIHAHWTYEFALAAIASGKPHLITCRDTPLKVFLYKHDLYRFQRLFMAVSVFKNGQNFSVTTPYMKREIDFWTSKPKTVIPNFINRTWCNSTIINMNDNEGVCSKIICVNNGWGKRKNVDTMLIAFSLLRTKISNISLDLFGHDYGPNEMAEQWASKRNLDRNVTFKGFIEYEQLREILPRYDIFVHPSREESFGMTIIEAMASGVPVVAGKNSGAVPWVMDYGKAGMLVDITSADAIVNAILKLIMNKEYCNKLKITALNYVKQNFYADSVISMYEDKYQEILQPISKPITVR